MEYKSPAYQVIAVPVEKIVPNSYNPNAVAPPEMKLLYESIKADGYTMPIVCYYLRERISILLWTGSTGTGLCWSMRIFTKERTVCCR